MCTVKKDINLPESPLSELVEPAPVTPKAAPPPPADYDLINRQQSQLLLDMIYASSKKKPCFFSSKLPCPGTAAAAAVASDSTRTLTEEMAKIKATLADIQVQLQQLPSTIVAALAAANGQQNSDTSDSDTEDDFDKLSTASELTTTRGGCSARTSMSSDIEVLNYCAGRPSCSGASTVSAASQTSSLPVVDITKEILQLGASLKALEIPRQASPPVTTVAMPSSESAKTIAHNIFQHWADRYATSKAEVDERTSTGAPMGNIRSPSSCSKETTPTVPKILPYNSAIDLNVWLK